MRPESGRVNAEISDITTSQSVTPSRHHHVTRHVRRDQPWAAAGRCGALRRVTGRQCGVRPQWSWDSSTLWRPPGSRTRATRPTSARPTSDARTSRCGCTSTKVEGHAHVPSRSTGCPTTSSRIHGKLRASPAMAAGVADTLREVADIVALVEAADSKPGKRGPFARDRPPTEWHTMPINWADAFDVAVRLTPALSVVAAILLARRQLNAVRRATALTIAKNHYRECLQMLFHHADLASAGISAESLDVLRRDVRRYRRYRWLFTVMCFSFQEVYVALNDDTSFLNAIKFISKIFSPFILSDEHFTPAQQHTLRPDFLRFLKEAAATGPAHPQAKLASQPLIADAVPANSN